MFAVFEAGGLQFSAEQGARIKIPHLAAKPGETVFFEKVLLIKNGDDFQVGKPYLESAKIKAEIVREGLAEKIDVYKFKRRTKYRKLHGHRQKYTEIEVKEITAPGH